MKQIAAAAVLSLSLLAAFWTGTSATQRRDQLYRNVCLLDQANVNLLEQSMAGITKKDVKTFGAARIKQWRELDIRYINRYADIAPCDITVRIPKAKY